MRTICLSIVLAAAASPALAECRSGPLKPLYQGETLTRTVLISNGRTCTHFYAAPRRGRLRSGEITRTAANGAFTKTGATSFRYQAKPGFKGRDAYAVRVCVGDGSACTNVTYDVTVQ